MKILLITTADYIHHPIISRHHNLFERMAERHEIHIPHFHVHGGNGRDTNCTIHECTRFPVHNPILHYTLNTPHQRSVFDRILTEHGIDVVVASNVLAGWAAITAAHNHNIPVIFDCKDWFPVSASYYAHPLMKPVVHETVMAITRWNLRHAECVTTVSPGLCQRIQETCGVDSYLIPNGVDTTQFRPFDAREWREEQFGIPPETTVYGFHGSVEPWYDLQCIIRTFSQYHEVFQDVALLLVGSALFTGYQQTLPDQPGVHFHPAVPYTDLPQFINAMDVGLIPLGPKLWRQYALPNKYFEYTACGKHIISTEIPDLQSISNGNVHYANTPQQFLQQMEILHTDRPPFPIDPEEIDWNTRVHEFERLMERVVNDGCRV